MITNENLLKLRKELDRMIRRYDKLGTEILLKREELLSTCTHDDTKVVDTYEEGGYYDRCKYIKSTVCQICDREINREITYGGYN